MIAVLRITKQFKLTGRVATISLEQRRTVKSGKQPFVCQLSFKKSGEPTAEDRSVFITTMRALTHRSIGSVQKLSINFRRQ